MPALHRVQRHLREGINGNMAGNIVFQHQTEQVRTDTGKSLFVHGQFATDAPAIDQQAGAGVVLQPIRLRTWRDCGLS